RRINADERPHLISPQRRDYRRIPGDMRGIIEYYRSHFPDSPPPVPEWLPMVRCIGFFDGHITGRNPGMHLSTLTVVWFQDEFAPPIREPALGQLLDLDWETLARDTHTR